MKIFKQLKKITFLQIFILFTAAIAVLVLVKYFGIKRTWRTIRVEVVGRNWATNYDPYGYKTPFWISDKLSEGQTEKDAAGKVIAEIIDIDNYERGNEEAEVYLTAKVEAQYNPRQNKYIFKGQPLDVGASVDLRFGQIMVLGQILDDSVPDVGYQQKQLVMTLRWRARPLWQINQLNSGDRMVNRADGEPIAEILTVKVEQTSYSALNFSQDSNSFYLDNQTKQDVLITVRAIVERVDDRWFLGGHQKVKVGETIWLYTDKIDIDSAEIISIEPSIQ